MSCDEQRSGLSSDILLESRTRTYDLTTLRADQRVARYHSRPERPERFRSCGLEMSHERPYVRSLETPAKRVLGCNETKLAAEFAWYLHLTIS